MEQQTPPQGGKALPLQVQVPWARSLVVVQDWPMGQQTPGAGPQGGVETPVTATQSQKGVPPGFALQCAPARQIWPQTPQLLSVVRSVQTSLQQSEWALTMQMPEPQQTSSITARQAPLLQGGKRVPLQVQVPWARSLVVVQDWPMGQQTPGAGPQGGVETPVTAMQSQKGVPPGLALQCAPAGQVWPQAPQLLSLVRSVQVLSQQLRKMLQQAPPQQR